MSICVPPEMMLSLCRFYFFLYPPICLPLFAVRTLPAKNRRIKYHSYRSETVCINLPFYLIIETICTDRTNSRYTYNTLSPMRSTIPNFSRCHIFFRRKAQYAEIGNRHSRLRSFVEKTSKFARWSRSSHSLVLTAGKSTPNACLTSSRSRRTDSSTESSGVVYSRPSGSCSCSNGWSMTLCEEEVDDDDDDVRADSWASIVRAVIK